MSALHSRLANLPRDTRDTLFLLVVIACCIAPLAAHIPVWTSMLTAVLLGGRATLAWQTRPLPRRWLTGTLLALSVGLTLASYRTIIGPDAGITLVVMLLALKTLELRARRDAMVVFFLGFFTLLANFLFSQSLTTAAAMLLALLGLLTALVNANLPVGRPPLTQSMRTAVTMAMLGAPIMVALFLLFPRIAPLWGVPGDQFAGRTGLSGQMSIGSMEKLVQDESVALRVRFDDSAPPQNMLYFRGPVLTVFNGRDWYALTQPEAQNILWADPSPANLQVQGPPLDYEVTLEPSHRPWLLTVDATATSPELPQGMHARMTPELQWLSYRPITSVLRYRAQSHLQFTHGPMRRGSWVRPYVQLPEGKNPRTLAWARQMQSDPTLAAAGPQGFVNAALAHLRDGGYSYTLEPGVYGSDTADEFWFVRKQGFCEHIASAFVVLMRALDIPARIVTGYQGGQMNNVDGYWTVRQSDAHAWAEVWLAGRGWVRIDPTGAVAPGRVGMFERLQTPRSVFGNAMSAFVGPSALQHLRALWEAANNRWTQWVLNYTQDRQLDLLKTLGIRSPNWQDLVRILGLLVFGAASVGTIWAFWHRRVRDPWQRLLTQVRLRLERSGLPVATHVAPRAMAAQACAHFGASAKPLAHWLLHLEQTRYSAHPEASLNRLRRDLRRLPWPEQPR